MAKIDAQRSSPELEVKPRRFRQEDIEQSVISRFEEQTIRYAQKNAVVSKNFRWTYSDLNSQANRIARTLASLELSENCRVALLFEHDAPMIAAMFATLKACRAYVPLDLFFPKDRLAYMLRDSRAKVIVTNGRNLELARSIAAPGIRILNVDELECSLPASNLNLNISPNSLAYVLYTSGSTGNPKGVMQTHRNVLHHIRVWTNVLLPWST